MHMPFESRLRARVLHISSVLVPLLIAVLLSSQIGEAQTSREFIGKFRPELAPKIFPTLWFKLSAVDDEGRKRLQSRVQVADLAFSGSVLWPDGKPETAAPSAAKSFQAFLVEPSNGARYLWADVNGDGNLMPDEQFNFTEMPLKPGTFQTTIWIGPFTGLFKRYPYVVSYTPTENPSTERKLRTTLETVAEALVTCAGRPTLLQVGVMSMDGGRIRLDREPWVFLGVDGNGDGKVDPGNLSTESVWARPGEDVVFRGAGTYLSVKTIDEPSRTIVLRERRETDYQRITLTEGSQFPDFSFTDFAGAERRLSEFKGRYVLLDFWATWCGSCIAQFPELKSLHESFHAAGFEVIGMDVELPDDTPEQAATGLEKAKKLAAEHGLPWPQATTNSIRDLTNKRLRISVWPTTILLDGMGRLIWIQPGVAPTWGEPLKPTLERLLGKK